jgi:hypothetical protein
MSLYLVASMLNRLLTLSLVLHTKLWALYLNKKDNSVSFACIFTDQKLTSQVHEIVGRINGRFGTLTAVPIHHLVCF